LASAFRRWRTMAVSLPSRYKVCLSFLSESRGI
jgi:hypothetical protein